LYFSRSFRKSGVGNSFAVKPEKSFLPKFYKNALFRPTFLHQNSVEIIFWYFWFVSLYKQFKKKKRFKTLKTYLLIFLENDQTFALNV